MTVSNIKATLQGDLYKVWDVVTDVRGYTWRRDLSKTEILNEKQFVEYTKDGYATTFTITVFEPYSRWEFDMKNNRMQGHWTGVFKGSGDITEIDFTEEIKVKNKLLAPFIKHYLKKQQAQFIADLQRALQ